MNPSPFQLALDAALLAGEAIMKRYETGFSVNEKEDFSPVTEADKEADAIIRKVLENSGIPVISEESALEEYEIRRHWNRVWLVDPLDGTKEFIKKTGEFTVNIALVEEGQPVEGLVFAPALELLYRTDGKVLNKEIWCREPNGKYFMTECLSLLGMERNSRNICGSISHMDEHTNEFIRKYKSSFPTGELIQAGSSLKFGLLAEGKASVYPRFSPTMEWDTAAGHALLKAAGGDLIDLHSGLPMCYNRVNLKNDAFIAFLSPFEKNEIAHFRI